MKLAIQPPATNASARELELIDAVHTPNKGINYEYRLLNADGEICSPRKRVDFDGEDYANWAAGDDVAYICGCVAKKLGLTPA
jgi:hypothetical protein